MSSSSGMRFHRALRLLGLASLIGVALFVTNNTSVQFIPVPEHAHEGPSGPAGQEQIPSTPTHETHPIAQLLGNSRSAWSHVRSRQSKTLEEAVKEYERRYKLPPPPNFDIWFKFAKSRGIELTDEYDSIYHSLLPFWGLQPKIIRARAKEALGYDNALIGVLIRDGKVSLANGGGDNNFWKRKALMGMMKPFVEYLPDMDLAFNTHDEPRVVIPSDDLNRLVSSALRGIVSDRGNKSLEKSWTRPTDLNKGDRFEEFRITRFNAFAHQPTWTTSRSSCPVDSPARALNDNGVDNIGAYSFSDLGFIYNTTAFSDICLSPSLKETFGMFERPNAVNVVRDLFPIFSESKVSSFQDILYPSPWYWAGNVTYESSKDYKWKSKKNQLFWRGSTTGGLSRAGGWRRQHRQLFVKGLNALDDVKVLEKNEGKWLAKTVKRATFRPLLNVNFSHVGQCDPEDCEAQRGFFDIVEPSGQQDAWAYKYLVDIDGNAFSGRYYAFLKSNSLIYKIAVFREWHSEWIQPWVHYVPLSLKGTEHIESVRYFSEEEEGQQHAQTIAKESSEWAKKSLKNEALEVWFFRLLLEYGRVVDDNRDNIGFSLPSS
ncbi:hypothetical protein LOZ12_003301 [Ophidiomyces ophidiicola]|uniref:Uncharacterized protein n=1 Tax=Ophidiomyces ophidiicola TaxID=1387563 RepID=A0ACB8UZ42_9EURO|nr:uncharacterized protein LOZ57_002266 [Ophidiomyces ophidiicola]KAI1912239.1 hypothetical protein LOZ61_003401 [Ophidiomyces ophidiicola]KAI1920536.1 hypothetical protein LOZ64_001852 [Ophidiomyces ophidiicola]KAI1924167.1 hypothetical protein LOZ60_004847 [Ophidiomyces ophidiicola]KAI1946031.1 hypothetical protein LOZ62_003509 [Ophidiomyces ophidiicola]KAI1949788.1 hypothetical protein LOZ57_002266 [Ophidiomyces ophidiicola]